MPCVKNHHYAFPSRASHSFVQFCNVMIVVKQLAKIKDFQTPSPVSCCICGDYLFLRRVLQSSAQFSDNYCQPQVSGIHAAYSCRKDSGILSDQVVRLQQDCKPSQCSISQCSSPPPSRFSKSYLVFLRIVLQCRVRYRIIFQNGGLPLASLVSVQTKDRRV